MSSNQEMRKQYFIVILLMTQLSTYIFHDPSFLSVKRKSIVQGLKLSRVNPFCNSSFTLFLQFSMFTKVHPIARQQYGTRNKIYDVLNIIHKG
jgi:hypothetical protein